MQAGLSKRERQARLQQYISDNPFCSDEDLARTFGVSVQTIRLDRLALGIPELRERTKSMAEQTYSMVRSMGIREITGDLIDLELGQRAISILETTPDMVFERSRIVRGQHIFAQADSLAIAIVDAETALVGLANVKFRRPVTVGEKLVAKGQVLGVRGNRTTVLVETFVGQDKVFRGKFLVFALPEQGGHEVDNTDRG